MSQTILVVEDEPDILALVSYNLRQAGFEVLEASDGEAALQQLETAPVDLVVLDLMLPGMDGLDVCRLLKRSSRHQGLAVIIVTARTDEVDRIVGFELGADDYLAKPFSPRELVLRVKAVLRRGRSEAPADELDSTERIEIEGLAIDPLAHKATVGGTALHLTATEFRLLLVLAQRRGRVQSRNELLKVVWGYEHAGYQRTVDTHVRRLRTKLGPVRELLETVRGVGYRFRREPE